MRTTCSLSGFVASHTRFGALSSAAMHLGCVLLMLCAVPASAEPTEETVNFNGGEQSFSMDLGATGNVTMEGNGVFHALEGFISSHHDIDIPLQTRPLTMATSLTSTPTGSATVGFDNATLANPTLADLNVDFRNGATWGFAFAPIVFGLDVETIGNVGLRLELFGSIDALTFTADPGTSPANPVYLFPGQFALSITGHVNAVAQDVIFGEDFDLGEIAMITESDSTNSFLPGIMTLTPQAGPLPADLDVDLSLALPLSLSNDFGTAGNLAQVQGHGAGNLDLFIDYSIDGEFLFSNLNYALNGTIESALVPEPSSIALAALGGLGLLVWRRKRGNRIKSPKGH